MKLGIQRAIRSLHRQVFRRRLPERLGIYLHSIAGRERQLDEMLGFLRDQGYAFATPNEFLRAPGRAAFLSFDDNCRSWLRSLPVLERHGVRATFYVNSWPFRDRVGQAEMRSYLAWIRAEDEMTLTTHELGEIAGAGHVIGAHTHTHPVLTALPAHEARAEIRVSKVELEQLLQRPVRHFAYPFGMRRHFSRDLRRYCRSLGFSTVANAIPCMQYAASRPDSLHRSPWFLHEPLAVNLDNLRIDGRLFHALSGRSAAEGAQS